MKIKLRFAENPINVIKIAVPAVHAPRVDAFTGMGERVVPRLRELAPCGQREAGGGIHAT